MSTLKVTNLQKLDGTTFPIGKIGQVVENSSSTNFTNSSTSMAELLNASIPPTSTSSKILVSVVQSIYLDGGGAGITLRVVRDSTTVFTQPVNYARYMSAASNERIFYSIEYLDSPSTTSSTAYKTQGICQFNTGKVQHDSITSVITLKEILA